jgi:hypothetical protein
MQEQFVFDNIPIWVIGDGSFCSNLSKKGQVFI